MSKLLYAVCRKDTIQISLFVAVCLWCRVSRWDKKLPQGLRNRGVQVISDAGRKIGEKVVIRRSTLRRFGKQEHPRLEYQSIRHSLERLRRYPLSPLFQVVHVTAGEIRPFRKLLLAVSQLLASPFNVVRKDFAKIV